MTKRRRKPPNKSLASRINSLEDAIELLREALVPSEIKAVFWAPGLPEPDMENLPKGHTVIRFVSECEIKELDQAERQEMKAEFDAKLAEREAEAQAEIIPEGQAPQTPDPPPSPPKGGDAKEQVTVIEPAHGVRWGFQPSMLHRYRDYKNQSDWQRLNRAGLF